MSARRLAAALLVLSMMLSGPGTVWPGYAPSPPPAAAGAPPGPDRAQGPPDSTEGPPSRLSYINGEVSFWRPGAADWAPAKLNTPLEPGDVLYTGQSSNVEIEVGSRAFVRASEWTQIGLDNQEPDFVQLRLTTGQAALDLRALPAGHTVELDTPNAAFTSSARVTTTWTWRRIRSRSGPTAAAAP